MRINLGAAPFVGRNRVDGWDWRFSWSLVGAAVFVLGFGLLVTGTWWWRARTRWVLVVAGVSASVFAVLLALTDGVGGLKYSAEHPTEYLVNLKTAPPAGVFVRTFVARINDYSVHVRGHPPGFVLLLKALDGLGAAGVWPVVVVSVAGVAATVTGVLVSVRAIADDVWMRRTAPLLVVAPSAIWMVTSADSFYAAVGAWAVAWCALAVGWTGSRRVVAALLSGLLLGGLLFLTYGGALFVLVPMVVLGAMVRRWRSAVAVGIPMVVGAGAVTLGFARVGFWWLDGARATRFEYWEGTAQFRVWTYFAVANVAVALVAIGPAGFAGLTRLRERRVWVLVAGGLVAVTAAEVSPYSRGEVERIWLLFFPWLIVAAGSLIRSESRSRSMAWITVQAGAAIVLQAALVSKW